MLRKREQRLRPDPADELHPLFAQPIVCGLIVSKRALRKYLFCFEEWHVVPRALFSHMPLQRAWLPTAMRDTARITHVPSLVCWLALTGKADIDTQGKELQMQARGNRRWRGVVVKDRA